MHKEHSELVFLCLIFRLSRSKHGYPNVLLLQFLEFVVFIERPEVVKVHDKDRDPLRHKVDEENQHC